MSEDMIVSESFIIACIGIACGALGGVLTCALRSRCSKIKCCCIECDRQVLTAAEMRNTNIEIPTSAV